MAAIKVSIFSSAGEESRFDHAHNGELQADMPRYTDIAPVIQISEVVSR